MQSAAAFVPRSQTLSQVAPANILEVMRPSYVLPSQLSGEWYMLPKVQKMIK